MPEAEASVWRPKIEKRPHPFGEEGVRSSLEEVAKKATQGYLDPRVRAWAAECLERERREGLVIETDRARAEVLLRAVQKKLWIPDPIGSEWMAGAHLMACVDKEAPCFHGADCDELAVLLASALASVGIYTMIVGQSYSESRSIGHVLCAAYVEGRWWYADPSTDFPLGKCVTPFTRERWLSFPEIKVVCDSDNCHSRHARLNPETVGFIKQGTFVGVDGLPRPGAVEWLGQGEYFEGPECQNYPNGLDEDTFKEYATKCGKEAAVKYLEDETGVSIGKCANEATGEIPECIANNYGITLEVYKDGEVQWPAVYRDAGAIGGLVACAATGVGAAALPLCGQIGGTLGTIAYEMTKGFVQFADGLGQALGLWGDSDPYLIACEATPIGGWSTIGRVVVPIGGFMRAGSSFVPKGAKLPGPVLSAKTPDENKTYWGRLLSMWGMAIITAQIAVQIVREAGVSPAIAVRVLAPAAPEQWEELVRVTVQEMSSWPPERLIMSLGGFLTSLEPGQSADAISPAWKKPTFWQGVRTWKDIPFAEKSVSSENAPELGPYRWQYFALYSLSWGPPCPNQAVVWGSIKEQPQVALKKLPAFKELSAGNVPSDVPYSVRAFRMPENLHRVVQESSDAEFKQMLLVWQASITKGIGEKIEVAKKMRPLAVRRSRLAPVLGIAAAGAAAWWVSTII